METRNFIRQFSALLVLGSVSLALTLPQVAWAWGPEGHQLVGTIADRLLAGSRAEQRIRQLLGGQNLAQVAVWADCVKNVHPEQNFKYVSRGLSSDCAAFENPSDIDAMVDYVKRNHVCGKISGLDSCHKRYHYTDVSISQSNYAFGVRGTADEDVVHAMQAAIAVLRGQKAPPPFHFKNEKEALMVLVHFIGDMHQPLHVGGVYLDDDGRVLDPDGNAPGKISPTLGGNALLQEASNLHALWDTISAKTKVEALSDKSIQQARLWSQVANKAPIEQWPIMWASDSLHDARLAFEGVMFGKKMVTDKGNRWNAVLPSKYSDRMDHLKEVTTQKAGARLAQLMMAIYGT